jgi:hypothetical protein
MAHQPEARNTPNVRGSPIMAKPAFPEHAPDVKYRFQKYFNNQDRFRPPIFKTYHPEWNTVWRPLEHLVDETEANLRKGSSRNASLRGNDDISIMTLLEKKCSKREMETIKTLIKKGGVKNELAQAFGVEYRKAYPLALRLARSDWMRSDFKRSWEFFAVKFGYEPRNASYEKRGRGTPVGNLEEPYRHKGGAR